ncbi:MAG: beta-ketoacyl-[acyl-carrier-protein] synthase family protein [Alphaproteobacteria bacterium]|nr:beta-ketoacyl-[acyl-carrier-protein] synthase family protein [Alphaproteobacteria bacterium]
MRKVAITGLGCISALGNTVPECWQSAREGVSGIAETTQIPLHELRTKVVAEVKGYDPAQYFDEKDFAVYDRFAQFALIAAKEAIADSGLDLAREDVTRVGVVLGTGVGGMNTIEESYERLFSGGVKRVHPFTIPKMMMNAAASHITMRHGITGPAFAVASACSSANHAMGIAMGMIRQGQTDVVITGGSEAVITLGVIKSWEALRVVAPDTCRPFCVDRKGMVIGEGAGIAIFEDLERAQARGATIYAEVAGFGMSSDAADLVTPATEGAARAMTAALDDAGLNPDDVAYINAHGTGTPANDGNETKAIRMAFGEHAERLAISSTKAMHGHALGAAGALELIATVGALREGVVAPTANFTEADPECDLDYVPNVARDMDVPAALSNSFAFGGLNAVLALRRAS